MSFYTCLSYYRPGPPPTMVADDLSRFMAAIRESANFADEAFRSFQIKFGDSIDQDDRRTSWEDESTQGVCVIRDIDWDIDLNQPHLTDMIGAIASDDRRIYRATIVLGMPSGEVLQSITRVNSPENEVDFCPADLSIEVGPIEVYTLTSDAIPRVGWISVGLSGSGYLFPWTFGQLVRRADDCAGIQRLKEICRSTWPVQPTTLTAQTIDERRQLGDLWPYDLRAPADWHWGLRES